MEQEYIGKHAKLDLWKIENAEFGDCFHGEVWKQCPYCGRAHQMVGKTPLTVIDGYRVFRCECGKLFKNI